MVDDMIVSDLVEALKPEQTEKPSTYTATVSKIADGTVWVYVNGSDKDTPTASSASEVKAGDLVSVEWRNNKLYIVGNPSNPSAGSQRVKIIENTANKAVQDAQRASVAALSAETSAEQAQASASTAQTVAQQAVTDAAAASSAAAAADAKAVQAKTAADNAQSSAENASEYAARALGNLSTVQSVTETLTWITAHGTMTLTADVTPDPTHVYFVVDAGGDYTVGGVTYAIVTEPVTADMGTYYELGIDESLNNYVGTHLALDTEGLWLLPASSGTNKVLIATGAGSTYTTAGTYLINAAGDVIGRFTANNVQIGKNGEAQAEVTQYAFTATDKEGDAFFIAEDLRNEAGGVHTVTDTFISDGETTNIDLTYRAISTSYTVTVNGGAPPISMTKTHTQIVFVAVPPAGAVIVASYETNSQYAKAYTLGIRADNSVKGGMSVAEGQDCTASGRYSHAEGHGCTSAGTSSHAEGLTTQALYNACHSEGANTSANSHGAHAEGLNSHALAYASHAQNFYTTANYSYQTVIGKCNDNKSGNALEIGNGTADNARSNALTVDWDGRIECGDYSGNLKSIFDLFYPVGSYYETSDADFNPNSAWGGTWELEASGKVHVSAGTGYTIGNTGGSADAIVPYHRHGVGTLSAGDYSHNHATGSSGYSFYTIESSGTFGRDNVSRGSTTTYKYQYSAAAVSRKSTTDTDKHSHTVTGATAYAGTDGNTAGANMPPYIVVNRWHRTA